MVGGMVTQARTVMLAASYQYSPQTDADKAAVLAHARRMIPLPGVKRDGDDLHKRIHAKRWCVTRADLEDFQLLVNVAVHSRNIKPTSKDKFEARRGGPNIFTVTTQLIKPITAEFGNVSWALMLHPEGLPCDLFITHSWAEGVYEFVGKVLHSWPRGAKNAYCCMLSNPQNLETQEMEKMFDDPVKSPFAKALKSAKCMLVVPNAECSIYTRIWCVYEAYLASKENKPITTATPELPGLWPKIVELFAFCLGSAALSLSLLFLLMYFRLFQERNCARTFSYFFFLVVVGLLTLVCPPEWHLTNRINELGCVGSGFIAGLDLHFWMAGAPCSSHLYSPVECAVFYFFAGMFFALRGGDRKRVKQSRKESEKLQFPGRVEETAKATNPADKDRILEQIREQIPAVEASLRVLIRAGMSTKELRAADEKNIDVRGAGSWSFGLAFIVIVSFIVQALTDALGGHSCVDERLWVVPWLRFLFGLGWLALFLTAPPDRTALTVAAGAKFGALPHFLMWGLIVFYRTLFGGDVSHASCSPDVCAVVLWGPLMILVSKFGFGCFSRAPRVGKLFVRFLLSHSYTSVGEHHGAGDHESGANSDSGSGRDIGSSDPDGSSETDGASDDENTRMFGCAAKALPAP